MLDLPSGEHCPEKVNRGLKVGGSMVSLLRWSLYQYCGYHPVPERTLVSIGYCTIIGISSVLLGGVLFGWVGSRVLEAVDKELLWPHVGRNIGRNPTFVFCLPGNLATR